MATNNQLNSNFHQIAVADANGVVTGVSLSGDTTLGNISNLTITGGSSGQVMTTDGTGNLSWTTISSGDANFANFAGNVTTNAQPNITSLGTLANLTVAGVSTLGPVANVRVTGGTGGQVLTTDGSGNLTWTTVSGGSLANGTSNIVIPAANGNINMNVGGTTRFIATAAGANITGNLTLTGNVSASRFISNIANGTAPFTVTSTTRVANLNVNAANIADYIQTGTTYTSNFQIGVFSGSYSPIYGNTQFQLNAGTGILYTPNLVATGTITTANLSATGNISSNTNMSVKGFTETVAASANTGTSIAPDVITGTIYNYTANADFTFNGFTNPIAGQSGVIIITQDATGSRIMSSTMKFAGGNKTLSTAPGAVDMICVLYNGSFYLASLARGYA